MLSSNLGYYHVIVRDGPKGVYNKYFRVAKAYDVSYDRKQCQPVYSIWQANQILEINHID